MPVLHLEYAFLKQDPGSSDRVPHWPANCTGGAKICFRFLECLPAIGQVISGNSHHCSCSVYTMQERVSLRDCQVGPGFTVSEGAEHREEVLAKAQQQRRSTDAKP